MPQFGEYSWDVPVSAAQSQWKGRKGKGANVFVAVLGLPREIYISMVPPAIVLFIFALFCSISFHYTVLSKGFLLLH